MDRGRNRPLRVLQQPQIDQMINTYSEHLFTPTRQFAEEFNCSLDTIRKHLHRNGIHNRKPAKKIALTDGHRAARLRFARDYRDFDFSNAIFSDEKCFKSSQHGRQYLWRVDNTRYEARNLNPNNESGRITVNMWGWMSSDGPGELAFIPGRSNGQVYRQLLEDVMVPTVRTVYPVEDVPEIIFIQDNCPIHRARVVQDWLATQPDIKMVSWPSKSPDLNPIEHLWALMVQKWDNRNERRKEELVSHCNDIWEKFRGSDLCENLVKSMRDRCDAVIDAGGGATKY